MKTNLLYIFVILVFSSCLNYLANRTGVKEKMPPLSEIKDTDHTILFLGMNHLGQNEYYENAKIIISDLKKKGFAIYVENVATIIDGEVIIDTAYAKKFRKIVGIDPTISYMDIQNSIWIAFRNKFKLVEQLSYEELGAEKYKIVDIPYLKLLQSFETKYGEIILDSCDVITGLGKPYNCKLLDKSKKEIFKEEFIKDERNKFISETVKKSTDKKILLIYGKEHLKGIKENIENKN